jgi:hypothetical protein
MKKILAIVLFVFMFTGVFAEVWPSVGAFKLYKGYRQTAKAADATSDTFVAVTNWKLAGGIAESNNMVSIAAWMYNDAGSSLVEFYKTMDTKDKSLLKEAKTYLDKALLFDQELSYPKINSNLEYIDHELDIKIVKAVVVTPTITPTTTPTKKKK